MAVYRLSRPDVENLETRMQIYMRADTLYWSDDWSPDFYRLLARTGFINIAHEHDELGPVLLPEMQAAYAVLDWPNLHLSRSMRRWLRSARCAEGEYALVVGTDLDAVLAGIGRAYGDSWLSASYAKLLRTLVADGSVDDFEVMTVALTSGRAGGVVAGEIGYRVGRVYTSLTGFFERDDAFYSNTGTLQLALLAEHLQAAGFAFWNLGHPGMEYKRRLGARNLPRLEFLKRWFAEARP
jgi:Leu/Phe-tRNA-protein transferase